MKNPIAIITLILLLAGCSDKTPQEKARIRRFDIDVARYPSLDSTQRSLILSQYKDAIAFVLKGNPANVDSALETYSSQRTMTMFGPDIIERLTMTDSIETELGYLRKNMASMLPSVKWLDITGVVSTYNQSVILTDSTLLLGLNHYLGSDYPAYSHFDPYLRQTKTPRHLPYDIAEALISRQFPYQKKDDATVLNRILYEGAAIYAVNEIIRQSDTPESMGYNNEQWEWLVKNELNMWNALIERKMLFSIDPVIAERLTRPAPATTIMHPEAPGRAGRYIGYRIVKAYHNLHPEKSMEWLLTPDFYNSENALIDSRYSPQ